MRRSKLEEKRILRVVDKVRTSHRRESSRKFQDVAIFSAEFFGSKNQNQPRQNSVSPRRRTHTCSVKHRPRTTKRQQPCKSCCKSNTCSAWAKGSLLTRKKHSAIHGKSLYIDIYLSIVYVRSSMYRSCSLRSRVVIVGALECSSSPACPRRGECGKPVVLKEDSMVPPFALASV